MRTYRVYYWIERNDCSIDCEVDVICENIWDVKSAFEKKIKLFKRVNKIKEL